MKLFTVNSKAVFVNCDNYSLNMASVSVSEVQPIVTFFGKKKFTFFASSTSRWEMLKIIYLSDCEKTMWYEMESCRHDVVQVIHSTTLLQVWDTCWKGDFSRETKSDARSLLNFIQNLPFIFLLHVWYLK